MLYTEDHSCNSEETQTCENKKLEQIQNLLNSSLNAFLFWLRLTKL